MSNFSVKQCQCYCSGSRTDSTNYKKSVSNFFNLDSLANGQWHFKQANHGAYSNPGTQVGALNKDFGDVSQTDLTRNLVLSMAQATQWAIGKILKTVNLKLKLYLHKYICTSYAPLLASVKNAKNVDLSISLKRNWKHISGNLLCLSEAQT